MRHLLPLAAGLLTASLCHAGSSNSLLDVTPDGKFLVVANADGGTVTAVDLKAHKALKEGPVGDHPEGVAWVGNGPVALVSVYRDDKLLFIDTTAGKVVETVKCAAEPYGIVSTRDGKRAYVTHDYPGLVSE